MNVTEQQKIDREVVIIIWQAMKQYGDLTLDEKDGERWTELVNIIADACEKYREHHKMLTQVLAIIEDRARKKGASN